MGPKVSTLMPSISSLVLLWSAGNAVYNSGGDGGTAVFAVSSCAILLLLLGSVQWLPSTPDGVTTVGQRAWIYALAMALNAMFSRRVALILESTAMSVLVAVMAGGTAVVGAYLLFGDVGVPPAKVHPCNAAEEDLVGGVLGEAVGKTSSEDNSAGDNHLRYKLSKTIDHEQ